VTAPSLWVSASASSAYARIVTLTKLFLPATPIWRMNPTCWITATLVVGLVVGLHAQGNATGKPGCADQYAAFTTRSWNQLDECIQSTNSEGYGQRFWARQGCTFRFASNAIQAEAEYVGCMSIGKLMGR
jgi:hypothetical protein